MYTYDYCIPANPQLTVFASICSHLSRLPLSLSSLSPPASTHDIPSTSSIGLVAVLTPFLDLSLWAVYRHIFNWAEKGDVVIDSRS